MTNRLLLLSALLPLTTLAQTPDDSLKGRIWTATAQRIWADTKPRAPQPAAWPTNAAFVSWLGTQGKSEKSGIGLLRGDVVRALGTGHPATPAQLAQAILAEAGNPPKSREWLRKLNVPALQAALKQAAPGAVAAAVPADTTAAANADSLGAVLPPAQTTATADGGSFFGRHPWLAGLLGVVLGAVGATAALRALRPQRRPRHHPADLATPFPAHSTAQDSAEVLRLQNEVQRLVHYIKELEAKVLHYENASSADEALAADAADEPALEAPVAPAELPHQPALAVPPAASLAAEPATGGEADSAAAAPPLASSAVRYAAVPPAPFLTDGELAGASRPELTLVLLPDPEQPDEADFTLNPGANQQLLIGAGLESLQHFFDYDAPPGPITLVEGTAPGRLQRQGAGWQVLERGWLHVS